MQQDAGSASVMNEVSAYVSKSGKAELPAEVIKKAKCHILDTLGAMVSGSKFKPGEYAKKYAKSQGGVEEAQVVGSPFVTSAINAALLAPSPARADVGVQPILPGGSSLKPEGETPIQMAAEKVVLSVRQGTDEDNAAILLKPGDLLLPMLLQEPFYPILYKAVVDVTADFTMTNPTDEAPSMMVWFPLASALEDVRWEEHIGESAPRIEDFQVAVNGQPLEYNVTDLPNPQGEDKPPLAWASFPVTFPAGEEVNIQVGYVFFPQPGIDLMSMTLSYIFQTGAGWAGPIGKAELQVNLPYPASEETIGRMPIEVRPTGSRCAGSGRTWNQVHKTIFPSCCCDRSAGKS